jgi:hypothetical protein
MNAELQISAREAGAGTDRSDHIVFGRIIALEPLKSPAEKGLGLIPTLRKLSSPPGELLDERTRRCMARHGAPK